MIPVNITPAPVAHVRVHVVDLAAPAVVRYGDLPRRIPAAPAAPAPTQLVCRRG